MNVAPHSLQVPHRKGKDSHFRRSFSVYLHLRSCNLLCLQEINLANYCLSMRGGGRGRGGGEGGGGGHGGGGGEVRAGRTFNIDVGLCAVYTLLCIGFYCLFRVFPIHFCYFFIQTVCCSVTCLHVLLGCLIHIVYRRKRVQV